MKCKFTPGKIWFPYNQRSRLRVHAKKIKILTPFDPADTYQPSGVLLCGNNVWMKCQNNVFFSFFIHPLFTPLSYRNFSPSMNIIYVSIYIIPCVYIYIYHFQFKWNDNIDFYTLRVMILKFSILHLIIYTSSNLLVGIYFSINTDTDTLWVRTIVE